jgi:hypothetical protein
MRVSRRLGALGLSALIVAGVLGGVAASTATSVPSASAATGTPEAFAGSATATALKLSLLGINLTISQTNASADSSPKAHAEAAALTGTASASLTKADPTVGGNQAVTTPQPCNLSVPVQSILSITGLCSQSAAAVPPAPAPAACLPGAATVAPVACGSASVLSVDVELLQVLQPVLDEIKTAVAGLDQTVGQVLTNIPVVTPLLNNLLQGPLLSGLQLNLASPVGSLVTALERATELLSVKVLPSVSSVATTPGALTSISEADGVVVQVLPNLTINGGPLLSVAIGKGSTVSAYNRSTCQSASTFDAATVAIKVLDTPVNLGVGTVTLPLGLGTITLGGGTTSQNPDGSVGAVADGLRLNLLNGAIDLDVGHGESVAGGRCAVLVAAPTTSTSTTTTTLPTITGTLPIKLATTGSSAPVLPVGVGLILAGFLTRRLLRTRRTARTSR